MTVLLWMTVLIGAWCAVSVVTALALGGVLRRRHEATDPEGALRPLAVGPMQFWTGGVPDIPDSLEGIDLDGPEVDVPAPRPAADEFGRDAESVR